MPSVGVFLVLVGDRFRRWAVCAHRWAVPGAGGHISGTQPEGATPRHLGVVDGLAEGV